MAPATRNSKQPQEKRKTSKTKHWQLKVKLAEKESSSRWTSYRNEIRNENPERHQANLKRDRDRKSLKRLELRLDQSRAGKFEKKKENESSRLRMRKYRARIKAEKMALLATEELESTTITNPVVETLVTNSAIATPIIKDRKEYYRLYRQQKRKQLSRQKKNCC